MSISHPSADRQPTLWGGGVAAAPPPPANRTDTSRAAARSMRRRAPTLRERVLRELIRRGRGGATDEELQLALDLRVATQTARWNELLGAGLVHDSGRRRRTSSSRTAIVWIATDAVRLGEGDGG